MSLTEDNPYIFTDTAKDTYKIYLFNFDMPTWDCEYICIEVIFHDPETTFDIFGYCSLGNMFVIRLDGKSIDWHHLGQINIAGVMRTNKYVSPEARKVIDRILKLKAYL